MGSFVYNFILPYCCLKGLMHVNPPKNNIQESLYHKAVRRWWKQSEPVTGSYELLQSTDLTDSCPVRSTLDKLNHSGESFRARNMGEQVWKTPELSLNNKDDNSHDPTPLHIFIELSLLLLFCLSGSLVAGAAHCASTAYSRYSLGLTVVQLLSFYQLQSRRTPQNVLKEDVGCTNRCDSDTGSCCSLRVFDKQCLSVSF